ncbi:MAG: sigma 54-interacting transcriptional regulator, partial [Eggerthellaceae bacterium]|nr:sigma 54-interacting transcriptional regulator [Eggerthellaceae bacterium]
MINPPCHHNRKHFRRAVKTGHVPVKSFDETAQTREESQFLGVPMVDQDGKMMTFREREDKLICAKELLRSEGSLPEGFLDSCGLASEIVESWVRCCIGGLKLDSPVVCDESWGRKRDEAVQKNSYFTRLAKPAMSSLASSLNGWRGAVTLFDGSGNPLVVHVLTGDERFPADYMRSAASELTQGTIAHVLALREGKPFVLEGEEHYLSALRSYLSVAVPVLDRSGEMLGCVAVLARVGDGESSLKDCVLGLLKCAALSITEKISTDILEREVRVLDSVLTSMMSSAEAGVFVVDSKGNVLRANRAAASLLEATGSTHPARLHDLISEEFLPKVGNALSASDRTTDLEITLRGDSYQSRYAYKMSAYPIFLKGGSVHQGSVVYLNRLENPASALGSGFFAKDTISFESTIGQSPSFAKAIHKAKAFAPTNASTLLIGEVGTGREHFARAIHSASARPSKSFQVINCAGLSRERFDEEIFGYSRPDGQMPGIIELADNGTLFLYEVSDIPLELQGRLLQVLDTRQVTRIGEIKPREAGFRLISSSKKDLRELVEAGTFREDLYYRISSATINIPPLRQRVDDIVPLAHHFISSFCQLRDLPVISLSKAAEQALREYGWPGNVRQLRSCIKHACDLCNGRTIYVEDLPQEVVPQESEKPVTAQSLHASSYTLDEIKRDKIMRALEDVDYNVTKAAK